MPVYDIPVGDLDNESELINWIGNELVTNHHFVERRRVGNTTANNLALHLERVQANTYHNDAPMLLYLAKWDYNESGGEAASLRLNMSWQSYVTEMETVAPASVVANFDATASNQRIILTSGAFTNWVTAGYTVGQYIRVDNAANPANNGVFEISTISTTSLTNDTMRVTLVTSAADPGLVMDTGDTITVSEERTQNGFGAGHASGFFNGEIGETARFDSGVSGMTARPYLRARLITNPTSTSATPSEPLNFICVIETDTDIYRKFSFGEVVKLVPFTGGHYFFGDHWLASVDLEGAHEPWMQGFSGTPGQAESSNVGGAVGGIYSSDWIASGTTDANGRGWLSPGVGANSTGDSPTHWGIGILPHYKGIGSPVIGFSPSPFSGQSERWPITAFGHFATHPWNNAQGEWAPMAVYPDVFLADITNVDAYSVFEDDYGERFMVVPMYTKAGSGVGSSEKLGYLIRNPALVVT